MDHFTNPNLSPPLNGTLDHGIPMHVCQQPLLWQQGCDVDVWHAIATAFDWDPYSRTYQSPKLK